MNSNISFLRHVKSKQVVDKHQKQNYLSLCMHACFGKCKEKNMEEIHQRDNRVYFLGRGY